MVDNIITTLAQKRRDKDRVARLRDLTKTMEALAEKGEVIEVFRPDDKDIPPMVGNINQVLAKGWIEFPILVATKFADGMTAKIAYYIPPSSPFNGQKSPSNEGKSPPNGQKSLSDDRRELQADKSATQQSPLEKAYEEAEAIRNDLTLDELRQIIEDSNKIIDDNN